MKHKSWVGGASTPPDTAMHFQVTRVISITSRKTVGLSLVCIQLNQLMCHGNNMSIGNYDLSKLHYDGPNNIPGAGYGYDIRTEGRTSANPPAAVAAA
jgi:hypothetical protein